MKRVISIIFALMLAFAWLAPVHAESVKFSDVNPGDWYYDAVTVLGNSGIIKGYPDGTFKPNETITLAELAVLAVRATNLENPKDDSDFAKIVMPRLVKEGLGQSNYWAADYLLKAKYVYLVDFNKIVKSEWDVPATKEQALSILHFGYNVELIGTNYDEWTQMPYVVNVNIQNGGSIALPVDDIKKYDPNSSDPSINLTKYFGNDGISDALSAKILGLKAQFNVQNFGYDRLVEWIPDYFDIDPNLRPYVEGAYTVGAIKGEPDGKIYPKKNITRAEVCQILLNMNWTEIKNDPHIEYDANF